MVAKEGASGHLDATRAASLSISRFPKPKSSNRSCVTSAVDPTPPTYKTDNKVTNNTTGNKKRAKKPPQQRKD
jgi:hypothetical protein